MEDMAEASIDDILKSIREAIVEKERKKYFKSFLPTDAARAPVANSDIIELSKTMLVKREDIPYQLGVWSFDDVAKKMMKKYKTYFSRRPQVLGVRVRVKDGK
jgi:hypothetical protein